MEAVQRHPALLGTPPLTLRQAIATLVEVLGPDKARAAIQSHPALLTYAAVDNFGQSVRPGRLELGPLLPVWLRTPGTFACRPMFSTWVLMAKFLNNLVLSCKNQAKFARQKVGPEILLFSF